MAYATFMHARGQRYTAIGAFAFTEMQQCSLHQRYYTGQFMIHLTSLHFGENNHGIKTSYAPNSNTFDLMQ